MNPEILKWPWFAQAGLPVRFTAVDWRQLSIHFTVSASQTGSEKVNGHCQPHAKDSSRGCNNLGRGEHVQLKNTWTCEYFAPQHCKGYYPYPFGSKQLVLVGEFLQLRPVPSRIWCRGIHVQFVCFQCSSLSSDPILIQLMIQSPVKETFYILQWFNSLNTETCPLTTCFYKENKRNLTLLENLSLINKFTI